MSYPFKLDEKYVFADFPTREYSIAMICESELVLSYLAEGKKCLIVKHIPTFIREIAHGSAMRVETPKEQMPLPKPYQIKKKIKYQDFMPIMDAMREAHQPITTPVAYDKICQIMYCTDPKHPAPYPSRASLASAYARYKANHKHLGTLIGRRRTRYNTIDDDVLEHLESYLYKNWQKTNSNNLFSVFERYLESAQSENLQGVSKSTFYRCAGKLSEFEKKFRNASLAEQNKMLRTYLSKYKLTKALERVEADRININLILLDDEGRVIPGNIRMYAIIDCYTRCILAISYEFGTSETLAGVIQMMTNVYQDSDATPYSGRIHELVVDNGPGFSPESLTEVCNNLGITLTRAASNAPFHKPFIETFFRLFRLKFLENHTFINNGTGEKTYGVPGYNGRDKHGLPPEGNKTNAQVAALTHADFHRALCDFLAGYHKHQRKVLGGKSPDELWQENQQNFPVIPQRYDEIRASFHYLRKEVTLNSRGYVTVDTQVFSSTDLKGLYIQLKPQGHSLKLIAAWNPADAAYVTVTGADKNGQTFTYCVPNRNFEDFNNEIKTFRELKANRLPNELPWTTSTHVNSLTRNINKRRSGGVAIPLSSELDEEGATTQERIDKSNSDYTKAKTKKPLKEVDTDSADDGYYTDEDYF